MLSKSIVCAVFVLSCGVVFAGGEIKVACVGDSITAGFGIPKEKRAEYSFPSVLQKLLGEKYVVKNLGVAGRTMLRDEGKYSWSNTNKPKHLKEFKPDIIVLMLGTNDSKERHWCHKDKFEGDVETFIKEFRAINEKVKIYVCLPPPAFDKRTGKMRGGKMINGTKIRDEIIPILKKVAKAEKLDVIDVNTPFVNHPEFFADGIHPNIKGAEEVAKVIAAAIKGK